MLHSQYELMTSRYAHENTSTSHKEIPGRILLVHVLCVIVPPKKDKVPSQGLGIMQMFCYTPFRAAVRAIWYEYD